MLLLAITKVPNTDLVTATVIVELLAMLMAVLLLVDPVTDIVLVEAIDRRANTTPLVTTAIVLVLAIEITTN